MEILTLYAIAIPIFLAIDMVWIVVIARGFYKRQLGALLAANVNWAAAIAFYLLFHSWHRRVCGRPSRKRVASVGIGRLFRPRLVRDV